MRTSPTSTYRVQLHRGFDFDAAAELVDYLAALGVSHLYTGPYLQAAPGSTHGYDVTDPTRVNEELGGEAGRRRLVDALAAAGMSHVIDLVPNHQAAHPDNPAWRDVVEHGRASRYAAWFDIDWSHDGPLRYRRFFDVSELAGVRVEDPAVFEATHVKVVEWLRDGSIDGIRVDHPDGLADPTGYLERVREYARDRWLIVEKILARDEQLRAWPVDGTTGYDALNLVGGLFIDPAGEAPLTSLWRQLTRDDWDWPTVVHDAKAHVLREMFAPEIDRLVARLGDPDLREALTELLACLCVYRSYIRPGHPMDPADRAVITEAVDQARERRPDLTTALYRVADTLLDNSAPEFTMLLQQTSGGVTAKAVEDTAGYRYLRLVALNEVGGDPDHFGVSVDEFHQRCAALASDWPASMTTLSTHDTKRSEDVRARTSLLSEIPDLWAGTVLRWRQHNERHQNGGRRVSAADEYLLYQTLVGAWAIEADRLAEYALKAAREAKLETDWVRRDEWYERALDEFVRSVAADPEFRVDLLRFLEPLQMHGWVTSLAAKLVQLTMPGVPDVYQGNELWDHSLVDPDNRRPVDFARRRALLAELDAMPVAEVAERVSEGLPKLLVVSRTLRLRRREPDWFGADAGYQPLAATGTKADHVVSFVRGSRALTLVPRLVIGLDGDWADTTLMLPEGIWRDEFTGQEGKGDVRLADLLHDFPVALLIRDDV